MSKDVWKVHFYDKKSPQKKKEGEEKGEQDHTCKIFFYCFFKSSYYTKIAISFAFKRHRAYILRALTREPSCM